ncbi:glycerophosphodiester phosphodiesterase [Brachybacterium sp. J144]|uniref:glycerophosphoryl diester phosphodiesterase membrane domain-containing protein n=1 Tax=Brachybacterium sp. J144 TaxID=3116487 RepID=UPI002E7969D2|nr:glycerophosphodiester phosphodiesterase [Brachybacterium sp. J144]MEE1649605.1 glycerophosphodiester phosphodiesterase [Brachybacterium sp. J144]
MTTGWTAPGAADAEGSPSPEVPTPAPGTPARGPQRELTVSLPLFPLRPLGLGEILGAAVRIYRLRARTALSLAAIVHGISYALITLATGAGLIPFIGEMQAAFEDPTATTPIGAGSAGDLVLTIASYVLTFVVSVVAASLVTVALTELAIGEARGQGPNRAALTASMRRNALPAIMISLLVGLLGLIVFAVPLGLGILPAILMGEANLLTVGAVLLGVLVGLLGLIWIWARTVLAVPALVVEGTGIGGSVARAFALTRGRNLWRILGISLLLVLIVSLAVQIISGVLGTVGFVAYIAILFASNGTALVLGIAVLTILTMLGSYVATVLVAPFQSAAIAALYADARMRQEAWDVELTRSSREAWDAGGDR